MVDFIDMPDRIARLPRDHRGFPVPWFVQFLKHGKACRREDGGEPDFRYMDHQHFVAAVKQNRCWVCGLAMGRHKVFVIGPMCCVNRISSEPPCHYDCARFAARNCPFLTKPRMRRNEKDMAENTHVAGIAIKRNPGLCALWVTDSYKPFDAGKANPDVGRGVLFDMGPPSRIEFWCEGRPATRAEIDESVRTGLPTLQEAAVKDGDAGVRELAQQVRRFDRLLEEMMSRAA